jgi:hypothetical protein
MIYQLNHFPSHVDNTRFKSAERAMICFGELEKETKASLVEVGEKDQQYVSRLLDRSRTFLGGSDGKPQMLLLVLVFNGSVLNRLFNFARPCSRRVEYHSSRSCPQTLRV